MVLPLAFSLLLPACGGEEGDDDGGGPTKSPWAGKTYSLTIDPDLWIEPPGISDHIAEFVPEFLFSVADEAGTTPKVTIATALNNAQNACNATTEVVASAEEPNSLVLADEFLLHVVHPRIDVTTDLTLHDLTFTDVLPATGAEGEFSVEMDVNEAYVLFDLVPESSRTPEGVCTILGMADAPCVACSFDGGEHCLTLKAVQLAAAETSLGVEPIAAADRDPSCTP
jgi:hypothetical protein